MKELWGNLSANTIYNELRDSEMSPDDITKHVPIYLKFNKEDGLEAYVLANILCTLASNGIKIHETLHGYIVGGSINSFMRCVCGNIIHTPYAISIISEIRKYGKVLEDTKFVNELNVIDKRNLVRYPYNENIEMYTKDGIVILNDTFKYMDMIMKKYNVNDSIYTSAYITYCANIKEIDFSKINSNGVNISRINRRNINEEIKDIITLYLEKTIEDNSGSNITAIDDKFNSIVLDILNTTPYDESNYLITDTVENILNYDIDTPYVIELKRYIKNKLESEHDTSTIYAYENKYKSDEDLVSWKKAYGEDQDIDDSDLIQQEISQFDPNYKFEDK